MFFAFVACLMSILNIEGYAPNWRIFTLFVCTVAWMGGQVLFAANMLFESFRNEASVSAAWVFFWGFGYLVA